MLCEDDPLYGIAFLEEETDAPGGKEEDENGQTPDTVATQQ